MSVGLGLGLALGLGGCASAEPPAAPEVEQRAIVIEREECFGRCAAYKLTVGLDGEVRFEGHSFVSHEGLSTATVDPAPVRTLFARFEQIDRESKVREKGRLCLAGSDHDHPPDVHLVEGSSSRAVRERPNCDSKIDSPQIRATARELEELVDVQRWIR